MSGNARQILAVKPLTAILPQAQMKSPRLGKEILKHMDVAGLQNLDYEG